MVGGWEVAKASKILSRVASQRRQGHQCSPQFVMRPNRHSRGQGYNPRLISSIWCAPQAPSCQTHIYTVLKAGLRKADKSSIGGEMLGVMIAIEYSYKLGRKNILIYGAN